MACCCRRSLLKKVGAGETVVTLPLKHCQIDGKETDSLLPESCFLSNYSGFRLPPTCVVDPQV